MRFIFAAEKALRTVSPRGVVVHPPREVVQSRQVAVHFPAAVTQAFQIMAEVGKTVTILPFCQCQGVDGLYEGGAVQSTQVHYEAFRVMSFERVSHVGAAQKLACEEKHVVALYWQAEQAHHFGRVGPCADHPPALRAGLCCCRDGLRRSRQCRQDGGNDKYEEAHGSGMKKRGLRKTFRLCSAVLG